MTHTEHKNVLNKGEVIIPETLNPESRMAVNSWHDMEREGSNKLVAVNYDAVEAVAHEHAGREFTVPSWDAPGIYPQNPRAFAAQVLVANCFNFAFNVPGVPEGKYLIDMGTAKPMNGSYAMVAKLHLAFGESPASTDILLKLFPTIDATAQFFRGINDIPFPHLRFETINDFAQELAKRGQNPADLLQEAAVYSEGAPIGLRAFSTETSRGLVDLLIERFPIAYGADTQRIGTKVFPFAKRAQLVAAMLHGRALSAPSPDDFLLPLVDADALGGIIDYQVPRTARAMGMLSYAPELEAVVDNWVSIAKDSREEVEIRGATGALCNRLLVRINYCREKLGMEPINMVHLDYWMWSQSRSFTSTRPHVTETSAY